MPGDSSSSLDPVIARKRFGLWGGASAEELCRRVLGLAGLQVNYSDLSDAERSALDLFAVALGNLGGSPGQDSPEELRAGAVQAAGLVARSVEDSTLQSFARKLYPQRESTPRIVFVAIGRRALIARVDVGPEVE